MNLSSLFNNQQNPPKATTENTSNFSGYPDVFYTNTYKQKVQTQSITPITNNKSRFGMPKDFIHQILQFFMGKNGGSENILSSLLQSGITKSANFNIGDILKNNSNIGDIFKNIFSAQSVKKDEQKKDIPTIIDMSDYTEIKS